MVVDTQQYLENLLKAGYSFIPCKDTKAPLVLEWKCFQSRQPTADEIKNWNFPIGIICGDVSGGLICLDFDVVGKHDGAEKEVLAKTNRRRQFLTKLAVENPEIIPKLVIQNTPSGGSHLIYRCKEARIENKKLALLDKKTAIIETRGEGGYFIAAPSHGYEMVEGDLFKVSELSLDEHHTLIQTALSFNEFCPDEDRFKSDGSLSTFDAYDLIETPINLLKGHGWHVDHERNGITYLTRPDKKEGVSATWNKIPNRFYVFSSSTPFETGKVYKASAVYAVLECNGDYREAAKRLSKLGHGNKAVIVNTPEISKKDNSNHFFDIDALSPKRFFDKEPPPFEFIIPGFIPKGVVGFIYGEGGSYKSLAALWLVMQRACGDIDNCSKWLDNDQFLIESVGRSIFFSCEDPEFDLHHRVRSITDCIHEKRPEIPFDSISKAISDNCLIASREQWCADGEQYIIDQNGKSTVKSEAVVKSTKDFKADLVIIETFSRISGLDENDNRLSAMAVGVLERIRDETGATVLCVAHVGKMSRTAKTDTFGQNGLRGASALLDNARFGLWFRSMPKQNGGDILEICNSKTFRCKRSDPFKVKIAFPAFVRCEENEVEPDIFETVTEYIRNNPGCKLRELRSNTKGGTSAKTQAIKDAIDEGIIETKYENNKSKGYYYVS